MKVVKKELKTFIEHAICECGGEMIAAENAALIALIYGGENPEFEHKCKSCGKTANFPQLYPNTVQQEA